MTDPHDEVTDSPVRWMADQVRRYVASDGKNGHRWSGVNTGHYLAYNRKVSRSAESSIPSWLELPPPSGVEYPPVQTRLQELPFEGLTWENFERLCLRLVRLEAEVEHCQLYGTRGQDQGGIDIYARVSLDEKYTIYQSKRVRGFGPPQIEQAVTKFLAGEDWPEKTKTFVLCTSESLVSTDRADELETQRAVLDSRGIGLVSWDKDELEAKLKELPELVDDFFGRAWVEAFCGQEWAEALGWTRGRRRTFDRGSENFTGMSLKRTTPVCP